jgi:phage terminase Nu1 subunit (DNA packaging protein)
MKTPIVEDEKQLTGPQVAKTLNVQPGTVRLWKMQGCPCERLNYKIVLYRLSEVKGWLVERAAKETSSPEKKAILAKGRNLRVLRRGR